MPMLIGGIQKTSLIDYPSKITAIVFTVGCNFRCGYCHNPKLNKLNQNTNLIDENYFIKFLNTRVGLLDAVTITGGEPTLQDNLEDFIFKIKSLGYLVKLDTNGTNPKILENLLDKNLLDYVAMDIKAPIEKYDNITNTNSNKNKIKESINLILNSKIDYEFRTTVIKKQLSFEDFEKIGKLIQGAKKYYLQKFVSSKILDINLTDEKTYTDEEFELIKTKLKKYVTFVFVR